LIDPTEDFYTDMYMYTFKHIQRYLESLDHNVGWGWFFRISLIWINIEINFVKKLDNSWFPFVEIDRNLVNVMRCRLKRMNEKKRTSTNWMNYFPIDESWKRKGDLISKSGRQFLLNTSFVPKKIPILKLSIKFSLI